MLPVGANVPEDCAVTIVALPNRTETRRARIRARRDTVAPVGMRCTTRRIIFFNPSLRPGELDDVIGPGVLAVQAVT